MDTAVFDEIRASSLVSFDIETTGVESTAEVVSIAVAWKFKDLIRSKAVWIDPKSPGVATSRDFVAAILKSTLFSPTFGGVILFHNLDFDLRFIFRDFWMDQGFSSLKLCRISDTLTISRVSRNNKYVAHIDPEKRSCHSLKYLAEEHLGVEHTSFDDATQGGNIRLADRDTVLKYNAADAEITIRLYQFFLGTLSKDEWRYINEVEIPHLLNLFHMNWAGIRFDKGVADHRLDLAAKYLRELELRIFRSVGRSFNLASQRDLARALFNNRNLSYQTSQGQQLIQPLYVTPLGKAKVDLDTLIKISARVEAADKASPALPVIRDVMRHLELSKAVTQIENLAYYSRKCGSTQRIFPSFKADAKSGRVKVSKPNLLGLSKEIFKKSSKDGVPSDLAKLSPRNLLIADEGSKIGAADVKALDLSVIAHGAKEDNSSFEWLDYFGGAQTSGIDIHMAVFRRMDPELYLDTLQPFMKHLGIQNFDEYDVKEVEKQWIKVTCRSSDEPITVDAPELATALRILNSRRKLFKEVNLSTAYLVGANTLAGNIADKADVEIGDGEAKDLLERFYALYPEIRLFQDRVANSVYGKGYCQSVLGRKYYADTFDDLNEFYWEHGNRQYELICRIDGRYWLIRAEEWVKDDQPVVENMKVLGGPMTLRFKRIMAIQELDHYTFRKKGRKIKSKFQRKSEENQEDVSDYQLSRIQITNTVDRELSFGSSFDSVANQLLNRFFSDGVYQIPEKHILLYRVNLDKPSSRYFRFYVRFIKSIRKFFPLYCQGVANSVATKALTELRLNFEKDETLGARVLLFVHDEIVVQSKERSLVAVRKMMTTAVSSPKLPFDVPLTSTIKEWANSYS